MKHEMKHTQGTFSNFVNFGMNKIGEFCKFTYKKIQ